MTLPSGCYSDDTQLRLATSRAIRGDGTFDVEAFAKVELPVWLSYSLGAGTGSKTAASTLARKDVNWFSNFFDADGKKYLNCGGNGAAMRIQPHVWSASDIENKEAIIRDVVRNAVSTHGHARGILGAVFHAISLCSVISLERVPDPELWTDWLQIFPRIVDLIRNDEELRLLWLPSWEGNNGSSIENEFRTVQQECLRDINIVRRIAKNKSEASYRHLLERIGGLTDTERGSGTKTAILALTLAWIFQQDGPEPALLASANALNSDTDTIATMAGAILGAIAEVEPEGDISDRDYILSESSRLHTIGSGEETRSFVYPDLQSWSAPKNHSDAVGYFDSRLGISGLGLTRAASDEMHGGGRAKAVWQWLSLSFGQTVLAKRRLSPRPLPSASLPQQPPESVSRRVQMKSLDGHDTSRARQATLFPIAQHRRDEADSIASPRKSVHQLTTEAIRSGFDPSIVGRHLLQLSEHEDGVELAVAYAAIISKAKLTRGVAKKGPPARAVPERKPGK